MAKIHIELIPNMYDIGLFKSVLSSRKKLRITTLVCIVVECLLFFGIGSFVHYYSESFFLNAFLIILLYALILVIGYFLAVTIGDLVFSGPWLEKMAKGSKFIPDDVKEQTALLKNKNIYFILMLVISIVVLAVGCDFVTGGHIRWYQTVGSGIVSLHSENPEERLNMVKELAKITHDKQWKHEDIKKAVTELVMDEDDSVRAWAAFIAGKARMSESIDNLTTLLQDAEASEHTRSEAAIALGRLDWTPAKPVLLSILRSYFAQHHDSSELVPSIIYTFYEFNKDPSLSRDVLRILDTCLESNDCHENIYQYGFFYLKSTKIAEAAETSFRYLDSTMPLNIRCYAADMLRFASKKTDIPRMKAAFEKTSSQDRCSAIYRKYHEETTIILFEGDPMRALFVRAIGNYMDPANYDWIWMVGSKTSENISTRKVAEIYTKAMIDKGLVK